MDKLWQSHDEDRCVRLGNIAGIFEGFGFKSNHYEENRKKNKLGWEHDNSNCFCF